MKRTNIMFEKKQHQFLKNYAEKEKKTLGEVVREAIEVTYMRKDKIEHRRMVAIEAYKEGFISIGKLSEILGLDIVTLRLYLKKRKIPIKTQDFEDITMDELNA